MEMELRLSNDSPLLPSVQAFIRSTLNEVGLADTTVTGLEQLVGEVITHTVDHAYPNGEQGAIIIKVTESNGKFELTICDDGVPQDIQKLEAELIQGPIDLPSLRNAINTGILDEMHWSALGPNGKALHLIKWLHDKSVRDSDSKQISKDEPLAPEQEYDVRRSRPDEALQISQLIYRIYGNTYFNEDLYYPERVATQHANGKVLSIVAADQEGYLAGHCALEFNDAGPVAEVGQAAVDPRHRGRGLLNQMKDALDKEAQQMGLAGWYADSVTVHIYTQKSNAHHGGHICGVGLGVSPKNESFGGIAEELAQRVSCVIYFHWVTEPAERQIFITERHQQIVSEIYENLGCPVQFGTAAPTKQAHGTLSIKVNPRAHFAAIHVTTLGKDTVQNIRRAARELIELSHVEALVVELPLQNPGTPEACEALEQHGFGFTGIGPHFMTGGDVIKLEYLVEPLEKEPIKLFEPFADRLVDYALNEQKRVRESM
ncbi:MAG: GNAT family N-acetyltransferase [Planctomycetaceae bacterium]|nr:GNAT family N-acetyltransferase [Planctomycetaceae bacterium]